MIRLDDATLSDPHKRSEAASELYSLVVRVSQRRTDITEKWLKIHDSWKDIRTESFYHSNTFNHTIPASRQAIEQFAVRGTQMLLPRTDYFEIQPASHFDVSSVQRAPKINAYMDFVVRRRLRMRSICKQLLRCYQLYGRAIIKTHVKVHNTTSGKQVWPSIRAVDPFMFLVWPETAPDLESASMVSEDWIIPYDQYASLAVTSGADFVSSDDLQNATWPDHIVRRLQTTGLTDPQSTGGTGIGGKTPASTVDWAFLTEIWLNHGDHWRFCWLLNNHKEGPRIVKVSKTKFLRPDYRLTISREIPGEQYTSSTGEDLKNLQTLLNDQINVSLEGQALAAAPPVAVDPMIAARLDTIVYRPRAIWRISPEGVKVIENHGENIGRYAAQGMMMTMGLIDKYSGSGGALASGQPIRNMPRAGFAVSSMMSMSLADIRDAVMALEDDLLTPALGDMYSKAIDYTPQTQKLRIPGVKGLNNSPQLVGDIEGDWDMLWIGSLQQQDQEALGQRIGAIVDNISKLPQLPAELAAKGKRINWDYLIASWWRKSVGEREYSKIVEDIPEGESVPLQQQPGQDQAAGDQQTVLPTPEELQGFMGMGRMGS